MALNGNARKTILATLRRYFVRISYSPHNSNNAIVYVSRQLLSRCQETQPGMLSPPPFTHLLADAQFYHRSDAFPQRFCFYGIGVCVNPLQSDDGLLRLTFTLDDKCPTSAQESDEC